MPPSETEVASAEPSGWVAVLASEPPLSPLDAPQQTCSAARAQAMAPRLVTWLLMSARYHGGDCGCGRGRTTGARSVFFVAPGQAAADPAGCRSHPAKARAPSCHGRMAVMHGEATLLPREDGCAWGGHPSSHGRTVFMPGEGTLHPMGGRSSCLGRPPFIPWEDGLHAWGGHPSSHGRTAFMPGEATLHPMGGRSSCLGRPPFIPWEDGLHARGGRPFFIPWEADCG